MLLIIVLALSLAIISKWLYYYAFYWQNKGVPILELSSIKNSWDILWFRIPFWKVTEDIYWKCQDKYQGFFMMENPSLFVKDLGLIQRILIKDFEYFPDRTVGRNPIHDELGANVLFLSRGYSWKYIRSKVTQAYSSTRINLQIPLMEEVAKELCQYLADREHEMIDIKETCAKYSTDVITTSAYGIPGNSFTDQKDNFRTITSKVFAGTLSRAIAFNVHYIAPYLLKFLGLTFFGKSVNAKLKAIYKEQMDIKLKTGENRNDFLDFIIHLSKKKTDPRFSIGHTAMMSQAAQYFLAGFETIGGILCYTLYELAKHPEYQEKLRDEITSVMSNYDNINSNAIKEMIYLEMVLKETMRLYPVLPFLDRKVEKDYKIPDTDITLEEDTNIYISIIGMHMDPKYFPDPHKFDPERFSAENKANIVPFTYLPTGGGPRICIGARYGYATIKVGVIHVLRNFKITTCKETPEKLQNFAPSIVLVPTQPIKVAFEKL